jgi:hypothetical protein
MLMYKRTKVYTNINHKAKWWTIIKKNNMLFKNKNISFIGDVLKNKKESSFNNDDLKRNIISLR